MTATIAPRSWPTPVVAHRDPGWRFARELASPAAWRFDLRPDLSPSPRQLLLVYGLVCALSLAFAAGFWWQGVRIVGWFTGVELLAVGIALLFVARHATDRETIVLAGRELAVERHVGPDVEQASFRTEWVRVEPAAGVGSLIELSGQGRTMYVGHHVRPELRGELANELRRALRLLRAAGERH